MHALPIIWKRTRTSLLLMTGRHCEQDVLRSAELAVVEAAEAAAQAARDAEAERIRLEEQQRLQAGFNLARKVAGACTDNPTCAHSFCR